MQLFDNIKFFDSIQCFFNYYENDKCNITILQDSSNILIMNYNTLLKYLNIKSNKNTILFNNNINVHSIKNYPYQIKLLIYPYNLDNYLDDNLDSNVSQIWKWHLVFVSFNYISNKTDKIIFDTTPLDIFYKILKKNINWTKFANQLKYIKDTDINLLKNTLKNKSIDMGLRIVLLGKYGNYSSNILSEIDDIYLYSYDLNNLLLNIYNQIISDLHIYKNKYLLFTYKNINLTDYGYTINGLSLTELLEFGLLDKLNNLFKQKNNDFEIFYENSSFIEGNIDIWLKW